MADRRSARIAWADCMISWANHMSALADACAKAVLQSGGHAVDEKLLNIYA